MISHPRQRSRLWIFVLLGLLVTGVAMGGLHRLKQSPDESVGTGVPAADAEQGRIRGRRPIGSLSWRENGSRCDRCSGASVRWGVSSVTTKSR